LKGGLMENKQLMLVNRILLGLLMLVPGIIKITGPSGIVGMLSGMTFFSLTPTFWAWVLILSEIVFGIAILANYKMKYVVWPPMVILLVAAFTANWEKWPGFIMHLVAVSNYLLIGNSAE